jgi:phosphatidate cytidylyltransferase
MKRVLTASVLFPLAIYSIFWAPYWIFVGIVALFAVLCYHEYAGIVAAHGIEGPLWLGHVTGLVLLANPEPGRLLVLIALTVALGIRNVAAFLPFSAAVILGSLYVFGAWRCAIDLRAISPYWILYALAINWAGDIAAFYVGRAIGKHKLAPRISPGKSWEGAAASMAGAILLGVVAEHYIDLGVTWPEMMFLTFVSNIAGQVGDLAESAMKRGGGLKDSGTMLPGHGGILDRLDSSLFTLPVVYYFLHYRALLIP